MKYKVLDEFSGEVGLFDDLKEAIKHAYNIQGVLVKINDNGEEEFIKDYGDF